ncbi:monosaccharide-P-dolichol utilization protein, putative [Talaromyces stipitatus ATCC 10500]|uniref:Mannose-P-dolichol utilization defect 1 protein homolog n=1 Tax=Talaromyces stipitatus (strain ATCC 10500 / CBS 375.48 / QM 6759 / NRRL 1006) TaxID=441959 RepID=B8MGE2_TALSN|nr:monosaccharide-P-dolichol utilization protein, putative [Talaromyces stipitatus ATCC 10500]EED16262.1 monosaccharide-P-dolichol utilization protein, putative [Talaromyces stipitatus ATCC 10500]
MDKLQTFVIEPLQPVLKPISNALPAPVHDAIISLIGGPCHSALLLDLDVNKDPRCTSLAISKALGLAIVGASAIVKVPQILKLVNSRSSAGVSFMSYAMETASLLITLSYNVRQQFPFSTYGESALIAVQDVVIGVLVLSFAGKPAGAAAFVAAVAVSIYALLFDASLVDAHTLSLLQAGAGVLGVTSKLPQIFAIYKEGSTGQLSAFAVFNYLLGTLSRIFTTLQEVDDNLILYSIVAAFVLNAVLALQMVYYWNSPAKKTAVPAKENKKAIANSPAAGQASGVSPKPAGKTPTTRRRG